MNKFRSIPSYNNKCYIHSYVAQNSYVIQCAVDLEELQVPDADWYDDEADDAMEM
ncbi:hypothetical protein [Psychrobacter lutiphocae]|uniref:hypothetical protein n=1 Tax=Psychrobacter lutiphocae TaxID=540500 RepID=UPI000363B725|nr:hypothetical protein [Psychrobacter lutiphocae]